MLASDVAPPTGWAALSRCHKAWWAAVTVRTACAAASLGVTLPAAMMRPNSALIAASNAALSVPELAALPAQVHSCLSNALCIAILGAMAMSITADADVDEPDA